MHTWESEKPNIDDFRKMHDSIEKSRAKKIKDFVIVNYEIENGLVVFKDCYGNIACIVGEDFLEELQKPTEVQE